MREKNKCGNFFDGNVSIKLLNNFVVRVSLSAA